MPEKQIYQVSDKDRVGIIAAVGCLSMFLILALFESPKPGFLLAFLSLLLVFCVFTALRFSYDKVVVADTEIIVTRYFRTKRISWNDISSLEAKGKGFLISNSGGDTLIFVSGEVMNLWKFITLVNERCGDLLRPTRNVFHENLVVAWFMSIVGSLIACYSIAQVVSDPVNLLPKICFLGIGLAFVLLPIFALKKFIFDDDGLIIKLWAREHIIHLRDINYVSFSNNTGLITAKDHYSVSIDNLSEGIPSFLVTFQSWLKSHPRDFSETSGDLYEVA